MLLPSGYRVRGVIPGISELGRRGLLDERAQQAVLRLAKPEHLKTDEPADEDLAGALDAMVAGYCREALDPDGETWLPTNLTPSDLGTLDQRDRDLLEMLVLRIFSAEDITARVETGAYDMEGPGEYERLADFRDHEDGAAHRPDGEDVADPPVATDAGGG